MLIRYKTGVNASAENVFTCVDNPEYIVQWVEGAVEHTYITERGPTSAVGQKFRQRLRMGKSIKEFQGTVIAWERPTHFGLSIPAPAYSSQAHFYISPEGAARSTVEYTIDVTFHKPLLQAVAPLMKIPLTFFVKKQIGRLKSLAEGLQASSKAAR